MKKYFIGFLSIFLLVVLFSHAYAFQKDFSKLPLYFVKNEGQVKSQAVKYFSTAGMASFYFTPDGAAFSFTDKTQIRLSYIGANCKTQIYGEEKTGAVFNYLTGKEKKINQPSYSKVVYKDLYPGIDLAYRSKAGKLEKVFTINPGIENQAEKIQIKYEGIEKISTDDKGNLILQTIEGNLSESKPYAYQIINGKETAVEAEYRVASNNTYGFEVGEYDPEYTLIIDPTLAYSTYIGGSGSDYGYTIALDSSGNIYLSGQTKSNNYPVSAGAYDASYNGGTYDTFITKLSADGSSIIYSTFLGGSGGENGRFLKVDDSGNAILAGQTTSSNFPTTAGAFQTSFNGGTADCFVVKINSSGNALIYSTYLGGNNTESLMFIMADSSGNAYLVGSTKSANFPTSAGAYDPNYNGNSDVFITEINSAGNGIIASTFLGGSGSDVGYCLAKDNSGNLIITGFTASADFPTTAGAYDNSFNGNSDVFIVKLDSTMSHLIYSTFFGGSGNENPAKVSIDESNNVYICGQTGSIDFLVTSGAFDTSFNGGVYDIFMAKLDSTMSHLTYSTFLGGSGMEYNSFFEIDQFGNVYITGTTQSTDFPTTSGAFSKNYLGGLNDVFIAKLNSLGTNLIYSTYFGGSGNDRCFACRLDNSHNLIVYSYTSSTDFPVTQGAYSLVNSGVDDLAVSKFIFEPSSPGEFTVTAESTTSLRYSWADNSDNEDGFRILDGLNNLKVEVAAGITLKTESGLLANTQYTRKVQAYNGGGAGTSETVSKYTLIEASNGATWEGISANSITIHSTNEPSNLSSGNSGILFENATKGTNSGWIKINSWTSSGLNEYSAYSFRISTRNGDGIISSTVEAGCFTPDSTAPGIVDLLYPVNNSTTNESKPVFSWSAAEDTLSGAAGYEIRINGTSMGMVSSTNYTPAVSLADGTYAWDVRAKDNSGNWGNYSSSSTFKVDTAKPEILQSIGSDASQKIEVNAPIVIKFSKSMDPKSVEENFSMEIEKISSAGVKKLSAGMQGSFSYSSDNMNLTFTPTQTLAYATTYKITIGTAAKDINGNSLSAPYVISFTTVAAIIPPVITDVYIGNRYYQKNLVQQGEKFYTGKTAKITAVIKADDGINTNQISLTYANTTAVPQAFTIASANGKVTECRIEYTFSNLAAGDNMVEIKAENGGGMTSETLILTVKEGLEVVGDAVFYPSPFSISRDKTAYIQYTLSEDSNIDIYVTSMNAEIIKKIRISAGSEGGKAQLNKVAWDGRTDFGSLAGNGVYVATIVSEGRLLKKFKFAIKD